MRRETFGTNLRELWAIRQRCKSIRESLYRDMAPKGVDCSAAGQRKGQSKTGSFVEAVANILVGVVVAFASQLIIFSHYGVHLSLGANAAMTFWFTLISLVRSFLLRRFFNYLTTHPIQPSDLTEAESIAALWPR